MPGITRLRLHNLGTMSTNPAAVLLGESAKLPAQLGSCREPRRQGESPGWLHCHMRLFPSGNPQLSGVPDSAWWFRHQGASPDRLPQVAWVPPPHIVKTPWAVVVTRVPPPPFQSLGPNLDLLKQSASSALLQMQTTRQSHRYRFCVTRQGKHGKYILGFVVGCFG